MHARAAGRAGEVYALLSDREDASAEDLEALADAAWWLCRVEESLEARQKAYSAYAAAGDARRAGYNAWMLGTEYGFIGRGALAAGWLQRAQRHLRGEPECVEQGLVALAETEVAEHEGDHERAVALAQRMTEIGRRCGSADLVAMGLLTQGRLLLAEGRTAVGIALLDESMCDVLAGELGDLFTGWMYCLAVEVCYGIADLGRASAWNEAAMAWCAALPEGTPFHGLCRVYRVELIGLRGALADARAEADRACAELMAYHPAMAAESFYVAGEIRRRMGDLAAAEEAFRKAHELGREPQPGLALLRLAQGRGEAAAAALRSALVGGGWSPLARARLLAAQVEVALAVGDVDAARAASAEADRIADTSRAALLEALAASARGAVRLAEGHPLEALEPLRRARGLWLDLGLPYEAAEVRMRIAAAGRAAGDEETARLELHAARAVFERLGSAADVSRATLTAVADSPGGLSRREVEVLRLVAEGKTNRDIAADLVLSEHTVARHLNNIFAKLGVSSRAAATAFAYSHHLL